jgi:23S rRNA-intervening sequence protein
VTSERQELFQVEGLAKGSRADSSRFSANREIPEIGFVWNRFAGPSFLIFCGREHRRGLWQGDHKELLRSLQIARGELEETRYFMLLSRDLAKISKEEFTQVSEDCDATGRLINALGRSLRNRLSAEVQSPVTSHQSRPR